MGLSQGPPALLPFSVIVGPYNECHSSGVSLQAICNAFNHQSFFFLNHSNIRHGFSVQLPVARRWSCEASAGPSLAHSPQTSPDDQSIRDLSSENKKCKNIKFLMDHRDNKAPEPSHASEFAAQTYFVRLAEATTSWGKTLLGKWFRERKTIWNCLQPALLRQYGSEFQFSVNNSPSPSVSAVLMSCHPINTGCVLGIRKNTSAFMGGKMFGPKLLIPFTILYLT